MAESGHISWPRSNPVWEFNYRLADLPSEEGIAITQAYYRGRKVFWKASLPSLRVEYDGNLCGPYKDPLHYNNARSIFPETTDKVRRYEYTSGGQRHLVVESFHRIGQYRLIHRWIFREDGRVYPRLYSAGLQCNVDHRHHPYWRFDFDIDGASNEVTLEYNTYTGNRGYGPGWHVKNPEIRRRKFAPSRRSWAIMDKRTTRGYHVLPGDDGHADAFSQWDLWALRYHGSEDRNGNQGNAWTDALDLYVNGETVDGQDNVLWYAAHMEHHAEEGENVWHRAGPTLVPFRYQ